MATYTDPMPEEKDEEIPDEKASDNNEEDKKKSDPRMEEVMRVRLSKKDDAHKKELAERDARDKDKDAKLAALEQQMMEIKNSANNPSALQNNSIPVAGQNQMPTGQQAGQFTHQQLNAHTQAVLAQRAHEQKQAEFQNNLIEAGHKDPEFGKLIGLNGPETGNHIPSAAWTLFAHLPNAAAVIKHLKTNNKDYATLSKASTALEGQKFVNDLSDKLDANVNTPRPSDYEPDPDLSDVGSSDQPYSAVSSWINRNKVGR